MTREQPRAYNRKYYLQLIAEGHSEEEAARIASTEMSGAASNRNGTINARQTNCGVLNYHEDLPRSKAAEEAAETVSEAAEKEARKKGFKTLKAYYAFLGLDTDDL